jgi:uncharacterized membrane protein YfcA
VVVAPEIEGCVRALLASPLGFLIGLALGTLGGGGSIVAVPALVYVAGQEPAAATTTSLLVVGTAAVVGMVGHARAGRVRFGSGVVVGLTGIGGSLAGSALNRNLDGDLLLVGFGLLVLVAAWRMVTGCPSCTRVGEERALTQTNRPGPNRGGVTVLTGRRPDAATMLRIALVGTAVGFLTGLFGVGGGFVIVPALTLVLGFTMSQAVGTSLLVIAINAATAIAARLGTSGIEWSVALPFTAAALAGVLTGSSIASRVDADALVRWFAASLVALSLYITTTSLIALAN